MEILAILGLLFAAAFGGDSKPAGDVGDDAEPPKDGDGPAGPIVPPIDLPDASQFCNIVIEADGKIASLCKTGNVWRIAKNGDELLPTKYADGGKAAQAILSMLGAGAAKLVKISTPKGVALVRFAGPQDYRWQVDILATEGAVNRIGRAPTMIDALGEAYEAAGGVL